MEIIKLEKPSTGYLHLDEIKYKGLETQESNGETVETYTVTFKNGVAAVTFTAPEDMISDLIGYDALTLQLSSVRFHGDGEE